MIKITEELKITLEDLDKVKCEIFVEFKIEKISKIKNLILDKFESMNKFSNQLGINVGFLSLKLSKKQKTNLSLAFKIAQLLQLSLTEIINKVTTRKKKGCFLPIDTFPIKGSIELASLVGHSFGDGHISKNTFDFTNKCEQLHLDVIQNVNKIGFKDVEVNSRVYKAKTIKFSKLIKTILILSGSPIGNKVTQAFEIPCWIKNGSKEIKQSFIRSLFDDEGSVKLKSREVGIKLSKTEQLQDNLIQFLREIGCILQEFNIEGITISKDLVHKGKNGKTIQRLLRICGIKNFINFQKNISFNHPTKSKALQKMIENTQNIKLRDGEGQIKILTLLNGKSVTTKDVAQLLNITHLAAWKQLSKLERKGLVKRLKINNIKFNCNVWMINNDKDNLYSVR